MNLRIAALATALLVPLAAAAGTSKTMLTVYNQDLALVRQERTIPVQRGVFKYLFEDVTTRIDATSVALETLSGPPLSILEQNYAYDLISDQKVLEKSLGRTVTFFEKTGDTEKAYTGTLLSVAGNRPVIRTAEGLYIGYPSRYLLDTLPPGLIVKPTLVWLLSGQREGSQEVALSYLTGGLSWSANYVLLLEPSERNAGFTGWVTLQNQSGLTFENATLKLLAGDVHRAERPEARRVLYAAAKMEMAAPAPQFEEKSLFEYHLYTLQRPATVADNETKQIELASAPQVPVQKTYVYDGANLAGYGGWYYGSRENRDLGLPSNRKVSVFLEFDNKEAAGLGIPLPKGTVRVFQKDSDGSAQFVGEDAIDHTPKDEHVRIKMGEAFDVVGERKQTAFKVIVSGHVYDESFEITLRNHKKNPVTVRVTEVLYRWSDWEITKESMGHEKVDSQTVVFPVTVPADGEAKVAYTVRYTW
ncbi:MAG: DUF4139 domain-containing protein [Acidobacteriota bacterium]